MEECRWRCDGETMGIGDIEKLYKLGVISFLWKSWDVHMGNRPTGFSNDMNGCFFSSYCYYGASVFHMGAKLKDYVMQMYLVEDMPP